MWQGGCRYAFEKIDPRPLPYGRLINVMDFDGMGIMDMKGARLVPVMVAARYSFHSPYARMRFCLSMRGRCHHSLWRLRPQCSYGCSSTHAHAGALVGAHANL